MRPIYISLLYLYIDPIDFKGGGGGGVVSTPIAVFTPKETEQMRPIYISLLYLYINLVDCRGGRGGMACQTTPISNFDKKIF